MFNCSRSEFSSNDVHTYFHRNMKALMQFNCVSMELRDCYKEGMFKFPNSKGFMEVSYFLLKIIYPDTDAFNECWPVFDKCQEREFRSTVCGMMRGFKDEFADLIQFPDVNAGKLMSPGGDRFTMIMWKLSLLALGVQIKRDFGSPLLSQPNKISPSNSIDYKKLIANKNEEIKNILSSSETLLKKSKEIKEELLSNVISLKSEINRSKSELNAVDLYNLDERLKTRLLDPNDTEAVTVLSEMVVQKTKLLQEKREYLKKCGNILKDWKRIAEEVVQQEVHGHKFVLDGRSIGAQSCDGFASKSASEVDTEVSLLDHITESCKNLKTLKINLPETGTCFYIEEWEIVSKERENLEKDFLKLESEMERIKFVIDASCDRDKLSPGGKLDKSLSIRNKIITSTPILRRLPNSVDTKPANITPYHEPSVKNVFKSHNGLGNESKSFLLETSEITTEIPESSNKASLEDIMQRFQLIKKKRKEKNNAIGNVLS